MVPLTDQKKETGLQAAAIVLIGAALGLASVFGLVPLAGFVLFLAGAALISLAKGLYRYLVLTGVVLLACVFMEPAPSDAILLAAALLGLVTGVFKPLALGRASVAAALLLAYFIATLPGIAASTDTASSIRYSLITFYLFFLALFICTYAREDTITPLLRAYVLAAFVSLLAGAAGLIGLFPDLLMADPYRVKGLFKDPNVFGPFFVPAIILLLEDVKRKRLLKAPTALHIAGIVLLTMGVVISYSRAAWINLLVAVALYFLLNLRAFRPSRFVRIALIGAVALGLAALLLFSPVLRSSGILSFIEERAQLQDYDKNRFGAQQGGLELVLLHPLGVGPGQFENEIAAITGMRLSAHSLFVRTAAENGVAGFLLFFSALTAVLLQLLLDHVAMRRRQREEAYAVSTVFGEPPGAVARVGGIAVTPAALFAVLGGILVNSLVVDTLHWRHFWVFIGFALYSLREAGRRGERHD